jgi:hypothetical protein
MAAQMALVLSMNNEIVTTEVYEESEKKINAVYLTYKLMGWDSLSNEQRQFTEELAKSCIGINGPSVYKARALWTNADPTALYNDDQLCGPANKGAGQGKPLGINEVIAYPNPANDQFKIKYNFPGTQNLEVHLFDHAGRKVKMVACNGCAGEIEISLSGLATGVYTYRLSGSGIISQSGKINVIKQ